LQTDLERRTGIYGRGVYTLAQPVRLGAFLGIESTFGRDRRIGYSTGLALTFVLDE